jgi:hypothetical protein
VAVALPALWLAAILLAFYLAAKIILTPAIVGVLRHIPAIGRFLTGAATSVVNGVESAITEWIRPHLSTLLKWMEAAAIATLSVPLSMVYFGSKLESILQHLVETKIFQLVRTITNPITRVLNAVNAEAHSISVDLHDFKITIRHGIEQGLRDLSADLLAKFAKGIDTLRRDVFDRAIPSLEADMVKLARSAEADIARVGKDVEGVAARLADLAKQLSIPLSLLEQMIAVVGIVGALSALETVARCEPKLRSLCMHDAGLWDELLIGLLTLLAFPGLREMTRMGATVLADLSGSLTELAES